MAGGCCALAQGAVRKSAVRRWRVMFFGFTLSDFILFFEGWIGCVDVLAEQARNCWRLRGEGEAKTFFINFSCFHRLLRRTGWRLRELGFDLGCGI